MKHIKSFEQLQDEDIAFSVGDTVCSVYPNFAEVGTEFKVERIFCYNNDNNPIIGSQIDMTYLPESKHDRAHFVSLRKDNNLYANIWSNRVVSELKYNASKYNI